MKKFAFLLAIVAVFAMSASAWAVDPSDASDVKSLARYGTTPGNVGEVTGTAPTYDSSNPVDGTYGANVYYYGEITSAKKATAGIELEAGVTSSVTFYYGADYASKETFATLSSATKGNKEIDVVATTPVTYTIGADGTSAWVADKTKATIKLTPTEVKFEEVADQTIKTGTAPANFSLELNSTDLTLNALGATPTIAITPAGSGLTATVDAKCNITFTGTATKVGTYTVSVSSDNTGDFVIDESSVSDITVANFPSAITEVANFKITVVDFEIDPTSATWVIGKSNDVVSFDVDNIPFGAFNGISTDIDGEFIVTSQDKVKGEAPQKSYVSSDVVISCDATMVVSLDKTFLNGIAEGFGGSISPYVSIDKTVNFGISTQDDKFGTFSVRFTRDAQPKPQSDDVVVDGPEDPNNDLLKATTNTIGVAEAIALVEAKGFAVAGNGLSAQTVVNAISNAKAHVWGTNSPANVTSLPIVSADIQNGGTIATIKVDGIPGSYLVSDDTRGRVVNANDLNVMKIVASNDVTRLARAGDVKGKTAEQLNGTFNVYRNNTLVDSVNSKSDDYELRVYIVDNGKYDLNDKVKGNVVDPLALVKSTGGSGSSSSSCDLGFGLVAVAGLAVLALRKRSK